MTLWRAEGRTGHLRTIVAWTKVTVDGQTVIVADGERHTHRRDETGWHVEIVAGAARSTVDLSGFRPVEPKREEVPAASADPVRLGIAASLPEWLVEAQSHAAVWVRELGRGHYRRSEQGWDEAGAPTATIAMGATRDGLRVFIESRAGEPVFAQAHDDNPFDNEHADTMRAGVQLHVRPGAEGEAHAWMLVPQGDGEVRIRHAHGPAEPGPRARWRPSPAGWEMTVDLPLGEHRELALDVIVNETVRGRERRRGQLVLSGARGEFVYLRGDRQDVARFIPIRIGP